MISLKCFLAEEKPFGSLKLQKPCSVPAIPNTEPNEVARLLSHNHHYSHRCRHAKQCNVLQGRRSPSPISSPPTTQLPHGIVSARCWTERAAVPAHAMVMRPKDSCPAILPIPAIAVTNPAANIGPWQQVVVAATAMEGGGGTVNSNGGETWACVVVDC
jgi:hypothetical protein